MARQELSVIGPNGQPQCSAVELDEYLKVWDLREGWTGRGYDPSKELKFTEIARHLKTCSISTVANRYRSAFEMITGHAFKPGLWWELFGRLRFIEHLGNPATSFASPVLRHLRSPVRQPVPESGVGPLLDQAHALGLVEGLTAVPDHIGTSDLLMDIEDLLKRGLSDQEIAQKLELDDSGLVAYYRSRAVEFESTEI